MTYIQDNLPPGRDQLMKPPVLRLNEEKNRNKNKNKNKTKHNPGFDSAPSLWDRRRSYTVPALPVRLSSLVLAPLALRLVLRPRSLSTYHHSLTE
jgi:hypothetical protein